MASKKRSTGNNSRWTYCQQLAHDLDAAGENSGHGSQDDAAQKPPPILSLAPEVRQQILHSTIGDDDLLIANLTDEAGSLSLVCQTFKQDMIWVLEQWRRQREQARASQRGIFNDFIKDLLETNGIALGSLAPPYGGKIFAEHNENEWMNARKRHFKALSNAPFKAMEEWRQKKLQTMEREYLARRSGNWEHFSALRRERSQEKVNGKKQDKKRSRTWGNSRLLPDGEASTSRLLDRGKQRQVMIGRFVKESTQTKALSNEEWASLRVERRNKKREKNERRNRLMMIGKGLIGTIDTAHEEEEQASSQEPSLLSSPASKKKQARRKSRAERARRFRQKEIERVEDMEKKWVEENPEEAAKRDERLRLRRAYGGFYPAGNSILALRDSKEPRSH